MYVLYFFWSEWTILILPLTENYYLQIYNCHKIDVYVPFVIDLCFQYVVIAFLAKPHILLIGQSSTTFILFIYMLIDDLIELIIKIEVHECKGQKKLLVYSWHVSIGSLETGAMDQNPSVLDLRVPDTYSSWMTHMPSVVIIDPVLSLFVHFYSVYWLIH